MCNLTHHTHTQNKKAACNQKYAQTCTSRKVIISSKFTRTLENIIVPLAFIIGTAGSGKSLFTAAFAEWLKMSKQDVAVVNLDPGALKLPYQPDVDVRNYVEVGDIMEKYGLGPNGALVMAADLIADEIENLTRDIDEAHADIVLVDTPGQMELFAFRASGPYIVNELTKEPKALIYLFDAVFSINPLKLRFKHVLGSSSLQQVLPAAGSSAFKERFNSKEGCASNRELVSKHQRTRRCD